MKSYHKRHFLKGIMLISILIFAASAFAGTKQPEKGVMKPFPIFDHRIWQDPKMIEELKLTEEQIESLRNADLSFRETLIDLNAKIEHLHLKLEELLYANPIDEEKVREIAKEISDLQGKIFIQDIEAHLIIEKVLTSEQRNGIKLLNTSKIFVPPSPQERTEEKPRERHPRIPFHR